jgi:hypothetical protein
MGLFSWLFGNNNNPRAGFPHLGRIDVEVYARPNGSGGVAWSHSVKSHGHSNGNKIKAPRGEGYRIKFDLDDYTDLHVRFDASKPFFCKEGTANPCPDSISTQQVLVDSCEDDTLVVIDWNYGDQEQELRYQLNFVTDVGAPIDPYDPIIINGGGGVQPGSGIA